MRQVFRSKIAYVLSWIWMIFAAVMAIDLVLRFNGPPSVVAGSVLAVVTALIFITSLRPATILDENGVLVRNPLRDTFIPWSVVDGVHVSHSILIEYGDRSIRCWTPQTSARERALALSRSTTPPGGRRGLLGFPTAPTPSKGEKAALDAMAGRTHADFVAQQITERAASAKHVSGDPRTTWSIPAVAASAAAVALVIAAIVVS